MTFRTRIDEFWDEVDPEQNGHAKYFLETVSQNAKDAGKGYLSSYYLVLLLATLFWILNFDNTTEFSFLSIKINNLELVKWVIPVIMSFAFYQGACQYLYENFSQHFLRRYLQKYLREASSTDLEGLINYPSFFNFERFLTNNTRIGQKINVFFASCALVAIFLLPPILIFFSVFTNFTELNNSPSFIPLKIVLAILTVLITVRTLILFTTSLAEI